MRGVGGFDPVSPQAPLGKWEPTPANEFGYRLCTADLKEVVVYPTYDRVVLKQQPRVAVPTNPAWLSECPTPGRGANVGVATAAIVDAAMRGYTPWTTVRWVVCTYINTWERQGLEHGM